MKTKHFLVVFISLFSIYSFSQTTDTIPPVFSSVPVEVTVTCRDLAPSPNDVTVTDNSGSVPIEYSETISDYVCINQLTLNRTWTATDASGNSASVSQKVHVRDTIAPILSGYISDLTVKNRGEVPNAINITATDNCGSVPVTFTEYVSDSLSENQLLITRSWTASDDCGNTVQATQIITVDNTYIPSEDTIAPVFSFIPTDATIACYNMIPSPANVTASDNSGIAFIQFSEIILDSICTNNMTLSRTWTATDGSGNSVSTTQIINVVDTQAPVIICPQDTIIYLDPVNSAVPSATLRSATGWDNCDYVLISNDSPDFFYVGTTKIVWSITDCTNNRATCTQNIQVLNQNKGEQITQSKNIAYNMDVNVYPNPTIGKFKLQISSKKDLELSVSVFNFQGGKVLQRQIHVSNGITIEDIDLSSFAKGVYQLVVINGDQTINKSVVVQ